MQCPYCGEEVKEGQRFCSQMGELIDGASLGSSSALSERGAPKRPKRPRAVFVIIAAAVVCVAAGSALAFAFLGGGKGEVVSDGPSAPAASQDAPNADADAPAMGASEPEPPEPAEPVVIPVSDQESELLQFMALSYYEVMQNAQMGGSDLVGGEVKGLDKAWLIRELAYPGLSAVFRYSSEYLMDDPRFSIETYSMQVDGRWYTAVSEEDGRRIVASYLGKDEVPDSDALANEAVLFDGHQFLIMSADGAGGPCGRVLQHAAGGRPGYV